MQSRIECFSAAVDLARECGNRDGGFSVYAERLIHKAVKLYIEPRTECHEVELLGSVADIFTDGKVYEVQTASPLPLIPKIEKILPHYPLTLVLPYPALTRHKWIFPETGELLPTRETNIKPKGLIAISRSLYAVRKFIGKEGFSILALPMCVTETRLLDGYGKTRRRHATLVEKIPTLLYDEIELSKKSDYMSLIPFGLSEKFTAKEFLAAAKTRSRYDAVALKLLCELGLISRVAKNKNAYVYQAITDTNEL